jgi:hypothetical protein
MFKQMNLHEKYENASVPQLIHWWDGDDVPEWSEETALFLHKTANALGRAGDEGIEFLRSQVGSEDLHKRYLALDKLANPQTADERIVQCLVDAFSHPPSDNSEIVDGFKILALNAFVRIGEYPLERSEVELLLDNSQRWLAAAAMVYLSHAFESEAVNILSAGLESGDAIIRGHACTEAGFRKLRPLIDKVESLLKDSDDFVARSAQIACEVFDLAR